VEVGFKRQIWSTFKLTENIEMLQRLLVALAVLIAVSAKMVFGSVHNANESQKRSFDTALNSTTRVLADGSGKKEVCTIVVKDKIRGHLNWMQVTSKRVY